MEVFIEQEAGPFHKATLYGMLESDRSLDGFQDTQDLLRRNIGKDLIAHKHIPP
jgi:hypothetical protein